MKRSHGDGSIQRRGENSWRLRYRVGDDRHEVTFRGTRDDAKKELRKILKSADDGQHVDPSKKTLGQWIEEWLAAGAPGRKKRRVGQRSLERYEQVLNIYVKPTLGKTALQKLTASMIDRLYADIAKSEIAPRTALQIHVIFGACLATAHRKGEIAHNPMAKVEQVPNLNPLPEDREAEIDAIGEGLSEAELSNLVGGFKSSSAYSIVTLAAATGMRRNELLALRWTDLDVEKKTLRIERALEWTRRFGIRVKPPKSKRGFRTIDLDDATLAMLLAERATHQRLLAGIPDGVAVDLGLIRLPADALIFPAMPDPGEDFDLGKWRNPDTFSKLFARRAEAIGFGKARFHDLRGIHATALLDAGIPVHTVAQRIGDDPAMLLRAYTKRRRSKAADKALASALASFSGGFLKP
jgi:integrase